MCPNTAHTNPSCIKAHVDTLGSAKRCVCKRARGCPCIRVCTCVNGRAWSCCFPSPQDCYPSSHPRLSVSSAPARPLHHQGLPCVDALPLEQPAQPASTYTHTHAHARTQVKQAIAQCASDPCYTGRAHGCLRTLRADLFAPMHLCVPRCVCVHESVCLCVCMCVCVPHLFASSCVCNLYLCQLI